MIRSVKHKGLATFFKSGSTAGIQAAHANKLRLILGRLNVSIAPKDMDLPGLQLHELTGNHADTWSVTVSGNWCVTFRFDGEDVEVVNYEDYH
ncbi:MAG: type II toxin-antitoxin system RelE/ParE family toxin [Methylomicrobium sp.]